MSTMTKDQALDLLKVDSKDSDPIAAARKQYLVLARSHHPDKGGDPAVFLQIQEAWEVVSSSPSGVQAAPSKVDADQMASRLADALEIFRKMVETDLGTSGVASPPPPYCIEPAIRKTTCKTDPSTPIQPGELRFGSYDQVSSGYGRWSGLCTGLKVPSRVHIRIDALGPNPSLEQVCAVLRASRDVIKGIGAVSHEELERFAKLCLVRENWAKTTKKVLEEVHREQAPVEVAEPKPTDATVTAVASEDQPTEPTTAVTTKIDPLLEGAVVVISGVFDMPGAVTGLAKGKDQLKQLAQEAGFKVTGSISGKTKLLVLGRLPGGEKLNQARAKGVRVIDLAGFLSLLSGTPVDQVPEADIDGLELSNGYGGNGKRLLSGPEPGAKRLKA